MSSTSTAPDLEADIDLTDPAVLDARLDERHAMRFSEEHVVDWLRTSGGPLSERIMKNLAADAIERSWGR